jgi:hypothetical protein
MAVFVLGRALPAIASAAAAMTGMTAAPAAVAANPRAAATLGRLGATLEGNLDKLDDLHLSAAAREISGEIVAWSSAKGRPFDHVTEVRNAMQGLRNVIHGVSKLLTQGRPTDAQRAEAEVLRRRAVDALQRAQQTLNATQRSDP